MWSSDIFGASTTQRTAKARSAARENKEIAEKTASRTTTIPTITTTVAATHPSTAGTPTPVSQRSSRTWSVLVDLTRSVARLARNAPSSSSNCSFKYSACRCASAAFFCSRSSRSSRLRCSSRRWSDRAICRYAEFILMPNEPATRADRFAGKRAHARLDEPGTSAGPIFGLRPVFLAVKPAAVYGGHRSTQPPAHPMLGRA